MYLVASLNYDVVDALFQLLVTELDHVIPWGFSAGSTGMLLQRQVVAIGTDSRPVNSDFGIGTDDVF